jgi:hypothetical protein
MSLHRVQVLLDEEAYRQVKRRAYDRGRSISGEIQELAAGRREAGDRKKKKLTIDDLAFVGSFKGGQPDNVSERHDEVLGEGRW